MFKGKPTPRSGSTSQICTCGCRPLHGDPLLRLSIGTIFCEMQLYSPALSKKSPSEDHAVILVLTFRRQTSTMKGPISSSYKLMKHKGIRPSLQLGHSNHSFTVSLRYELTMKALSTKLRRTRERNRTGASRKGE